MTADTRLLAHLTGRFAPHPEDVATEGLSFLLQQSSAMRSAFWNAIKAFVPEIPETVQFRTQVSEADGTRPDIIGFDLDGHEVAMIEAKFWAGLTANQPVEYLNRLGRNGLVPSVLVVVAPRQRQESLWPELLRLCRATGQYPEVSEVRQGDHVHIAQVSAGISMVLTTWQHILDSLALRASSDGDSLLVSDLLQLQSLAQQQDEDAFLPLRASELGQEFPRRVPLLNSLVDDLVGLARSKGLLSIEGLTASSLPTGYGRYVRIGGTGRTGGIGARVCVSFDLWGRYRPTPLWLVIQAWKENGETLALTRHRLRSLEDAAKLIPTTDSLLVPLFIPIGAERAEVLAALVEQVREVHRLLPNPPDAHEDRSEG